MKSNPIASGSAVPTQPFIRHRLDRPEGAQGVFGISNDTVPIIDYYLFIDVDPLSQKRQIVRIEPGGWASIRTEMKNWQLPLSLSRRKPGSMLLLPRTLQAIAVLYQRLPARAVGTMDPGISPGKIEGVGYRMVLAQSP